MGLPGHSLAAVAAVAAAPVALLGAALFPRWRIGWRERLGAHPAARAPGGSQTQTQMRTSANATGAGAAPVWVHAASVGEARAARALLDAFCARGEAVVASTQTEAGRALLRATRPQIPCGLAPLDHPWTAARALGRVRPAALALVETELWPCWIAAARARGVPVVVVSGRLSARSPLLRRALARWLRGALAGIAAVGARSEADARRFIALGVPEARVEVTGDLKLEPAAEPPLAAELAGALAAAPPLIIAGSTHEGEEQAALGALAAAQQAGLPAALVLAPRHLRRAGRVAAQVRAAGLRLHRRSALGGARLGEGEVLLLDTLGELAALWPLADVAFVGGSLAPVGGHNLLEPLQCGRAVLFGPHTKNAREAAGFALSAGAGLRVRDAAELARRTCEALAQPAAWRARGEAGRRALAVHRGAAARSLALLDRARAGGAA